VRVSLREGSTARKAVDLKKKTEHKRKHTNNSFLCVLYFSFSFDILVSRFTCTTFGEQIFILDSSC
jgi:hypothetical protein